MLKDVVIANKSYTRLILSGEERIDNIALRVIKQDCPDFLLPVRTMEIDGEQEIRYELSEGIRLSYSSLQLSKKEFSSLLENMLIPFKVCNDWFLDYHNILLDHSYIFLGKKDSTIKYLYIPVSEYAHTDEEIMDFFSSFILKADVLDDSHYAVALLRVLRGEDSNLMTLLDFITQESRNPDGDTRRDAAKSACRNREEQAGFVGIGSGTGCDRAESKPVEEPAGQRDGAEEAGKDRHRAGVAARPGKSSGEFDRQDVHGRLVGSLFGEDDEEDGNSKAGKTVNKTGKEKETKKDKAGKEQVSKEKSVKGGLLDKLIGKGKKEDAEAGKKVFESESVCSGQKSPQLMQGRQNIALQQRDMGEDTTEISGDEFASDGNTLRLRLIESGGYHCPRMVEIDLRRGFATVGRLDKSGQAQSDYCFDAALSFVSRRHFRIESVNGEYFIIDLGSGNGTFVNGEALAPNIRHLLRPGDMVMISQRHRLIYQVC